MTGLLLILTETDGEGFTAASDLAAATAALGRPVSVLVRGPAAAALGHPLVAQALSLLADMGAHLHICQTAMATHDLTAADLPAGVEPLGLIAFLTNRADWQVVLA